MDEWLEARAPGSDLPKILNSSSELFGHSGSASPHTRNGHLVDKIIVRL